MLFKTKRKHYDTDLRLKLCRKRLYITKCLTYLGIKIDQNLDWKIHIHDITSKLSRAYAVLAKVRHFINSKILISTYFAIFYSHLSSVCVAWGLTKFPQQKVSIIQKSTIMNFAHFNAHTSPLFKNFNILEFANTINIQSCIFIKNYFNKNSFSVFYENFKLVLTIHSYNIRSASNRLLFVPSYNSFRFGRKWIIHSTTLAFSYL